MNIEVDQVRFSAAKSEDRPSGLIGFVSFRINGAIIVDSITLRRTREGELRLAYPSRRDSSGLKRAFVRPTDTAARLEIESQVFAALPAVGEGSQ